MEIILRIEMNLFRLKCLGYILINIKKFLVKSGIMQILQTKFQNLAT